MIVTFVVNSLWQGLIAVTVTALLLRLVPSRDAATRYAAWFLTLAALVAIPALTVWTHFGSSIAAAFAHNAASRVGTYSLVFAGTVASGAANPNFEFAVAALWIAGAAIGLGRLAVSLYRIARLVGGSVPHSRVDGVAVLTSHNLSIPIATGLWSPAIVLPAELANALDPADLRCTIDHELAHVRRGDVLANALQRIVEAIFFWNPWVQLAGRRVSSEREAACDDRAALRIGEPREYAMCLAALGQRIAERAAPLLTPGAFGSRNALVARIERLTDGGAPSTSNVSYLALGGVFMLFAALTLVFQAVVPTPVHAAPLPTAALQAPLNTVVASACTKSDAEPAVVNPVPPALAKGQWPKQKVSAEVAVTIAPSGKVAGAKVYKSSGDAAVDHAVLTAAEKSTYSPKLVNCQAVEGTYLFKADMAP
jgi:TonB family protein